ncbi:MAG: CarD family transcriptional regulator [Clostridia bacterium]
MFNVGDKVVYPMHGAGIIEAIEEKNMLGEAQNYYIIKMATDGVKAMIPINKADNVGIREIASENDYKNVFSILEAPMHDLTLDTNWNKRYQSNVDKIKSGKIDEVTEVFKDLSHRHMEKGLSLAEKKMLTTSKSILLSELVLLKDEDDNVIDNMIEETVKNSFAIYMEPKVEI